MLTHDQLVEASKRGLIGPKQVEPLFAFLTGADGSADLIADPEEMHFARGFHDIFIALGLGILFAGYFIGSTLLLGESALGSTIAYGGATVMTWLLAEWFSKKLRLSLPSILLSGAFILLSGMTASAFLETMALAPQIGLDFGNSQEIQAYGWWFTLAFIFAIACGALFYKRFGVPITLAFIALAAIPLFFVIIAAIDQTLMSNHLSLWLFLVGFACLTIAMWFDMRDPMRQSVNSDKAFWLHLVAAPLIVHSALSTFSGMEDGALATIPLVFGIGLFALVIDRRALLASAIGYLGFAIGALLTKIELGDTGVIALTLLLLGFFVLMLGSGWAFLRGLVLRPFADHALLRKLPPVLPKGTK